MAGVLVITGASRGIGAATARAAAKAGWDLCLNYRRSGAPAEAIATEARALGRRVALVPGDMAQEEDVLRLFQACDAQLGPCAGLVNNAGITGPARRVADLDLATLRAVMELNVVGAILCAREAVRRMSTKAGGKGGAIVNVASRASVIGGPNEFVHYAASKGAIDTFTIGLAREVAGEGIRVNAVSPGLIDTEIHAAAGVPDRIERLRSAIPMGRAGTADEVADSILWLLSDAAAYVTGAILPVSGGR